MTKENIQRFEQRHNIPFREYANIHLWILYHHGKATKCVSNACSHKSNRFNWALRPGATYKRDMSQYHQLCVGCHARQDRTSEGNQRIGERTRGTKLSAETRLKIGLAHKGMKRTLKTRLAIGRAFAKPIVQKTKEGVLVRTWDSLMDAERQGGYGHTNISKAINGLSKSAYGYLWSLKTT
jgi:hypothetical protein